MSDSHEDPFSSAKENLRDTIKWLATVFAALAAVLVAGASLTGLSNLSGPNIAWALGGGGLGLLCIFFATGVTLSLLTAEPFYLGQLAGDAALKAVLERHAVDILPPEFTSIDSLLQERATAVKTVFSKRYASEDPEYASAQNFLLAVDAPLARLNNLAHFELMRRRFVRARPRLFLLAIGALGGLGVFAVFVGGPDSSAASEPHGEIGLELDIGRDWNNVAAAFVAACGGEERPRARLVRESDRGWLSVRLLAPEKCDGVVVTLPASIAVRPGATATRP